MAERYTATCRVCGVTHPIGPGWCKLILFDEDWNKTTEWLCPTHYKEFMDSGEEVIPPPMKCPKHPRYKGMRKPVATDCKVCNDIWTALRRDVAASSSGSGSSKT